MDIQVSTLTENKVRPTMTYAYKDRIWEPVAEHVAAFLPTLEPRS